jgi:quinoprotein glucose dehydrogenase
MSATRPSSLFWLRLAAIASLILGLASAFGGIWLLSLGGSAYFLIAGLMVIATGVLLLKGKRSALWLYALMLFGSTLWALYEVRLDWWQLLPRLDIWFALGLLIALPVVSRHLGAADQRGAGVKTLWGSLAIALAVGVASLFVDPYSINGNLERQAALAENAAPAQPDGDWQQWGGDHFGQRYSPLKQITADNVSNLEVAWTYRTGDMPTDIDPAEITDENTPLKVGNMLYLCTPHSKVIAVNATTGKEIWKFDPKIKGDNGSFKGWEHMTCRGVSYYNLNDNAATAQNADAQPKMCQRRLYLPTADGRLIALNADDGKVCRDFGNQGEVNLLTANLGGTNPPGGYYSTSPATVVDGLVIIGGHVSDNVSVNEPSGVVRAFDARDGHLVWNWDAGNPTETRPLPEGQHYTPNSPNMWSVMSVDPKLGLIYLPLGNQMPDQWGGKRSPETEKYSAGVVALNVKTGQPVWNYQFTHHDLWDMDVGGQPTLTDIKTKDGVKPALVASTKQGSIYVLDRRNGSPIVPITEVPRPASNVEGETASPTQPLSALNFTPDPLKESSMWGTNPFDMLYCRIKFKSLRYEGTFTPPSTQGSIVYPGNFGVFDWGGVSVDPERQIAFVNPSYMAFYDTLIPASEINAEDKAESETSGVHKNTGAPYGVTMSPLLTPWGIPCQSPPWGYVAAVDLTTHKVIWKHKNGTVRDSAPLPIPMPLGVPSLGGPIVTAGGVGFLSGTLDYYIRAYDMRNGKELWKARLPAGGQATPMSYKGEDGRQYIVVAAGGHGSLGTKLGDYVVAYALPEKK